MQFSGFILKSIKHKCNLLNVTSKYKWKQSDGDRERKERDRDWKMLLLMALKTEKEAKRQGIQVAIKL